MISVYIIPILPTVDLWRCISRTSPNYYLFNIKVNIPVSLQIQPTYRVLSTHADFKGHNILISDDGHLSGFLDWEFTTAMRFGRDSLVPAASWIGGAGVDIDCVDN